MPEGSLTLRVKVLGIEGLRVSSRPRGVRGRDPLGDKNPSRGVTEKADGGLQTAAREIALPIVPERCSWEVLQQSELQGASGPQCESPSEKTEG